MEFNIKFHTKSSLPRLHIKAKIADNDLRSPVIKTNKNCFEHKIKNAVYTSITPFWYFILILPSKFAALSTLAIIGDKKHAFFFFNQNL